MNSAQIIRTVFEVALVVFAVWAVFHEDMFVALEEKLAANRKRKQLKLISTISRKAD